MGRHEFTGTNEATKATALLLALFGWATLPLSSCASFLFRSPSNGLIAMMGAALEAGGAPNKQVPTPSTKRRVHFVSDVGLIG